jgi:hypothetical protein
VLDHRTRRRQVAAKDGDTAFVGQRLLARPDDVVVVHPRVGEVRFERAPGDGGAIGVQQVFEPRKQAGQAARVVEVLLLMAGGSDQRVNGGASC